MSKTLDWQNLNLSGFDIYNPNSGAYSENSCVCNPNSVLGDESGSFNSKYVVALLNDSLLFRSAPKAFMFNLAEYEC